MIESERGILEGRMGFPETRCASVLLAMLSLRFGKVRTPVHRIPAAVAHIAMAIVTQAR